MAKTKSAGSTKLGRDSQPKYLGVKLYDGETAQPGSILVRQRGTRMLPGDNVKRGNDDTLYATTTGTVRFTTKRKRGFDTAQRVVKIVSVVPASQ